MHITRATAPAHLGRCPSTSRGGTPSASPRGNTGQGTTFVAWVVVSRGSRFRGSVDGLSFQRRAKCDDLILLHHAHSTRARRSRYPGLRGACQDPAAGTRRPPAQPVIAADDHLGRLARSLGCLQLNDKSVGRTNPREFGSRRSASCAKPRRSEWLATKGDGRILRRMPRMQVYLPDDLYELVKERGLPASELLQEAVRAEVRRLELVAASTKYTTELRHQVGAPSASQRARAADVAKRVGSRLHRKAG
jgi:hypothetical protein